MNLSDLDLSENQIKAFFLGAKLAQKPLTFEKAVDDLLAEQEDSKGSITPELKKIWDMKLWDSMFPENKDLTLFLTNAKEQIDYFLTAMSLAGTNPETIDDEEMIEFIEELEEVVADLEDYLDDESASREEGEELKDFMLGMWSEFLESKRLS
jgi:hypothetical protein